MFGNVPGTLTAPPVSADLAAQLPGLGNLNATASSDILSNLQGTLSPGTQNALQDASASYGAASGAPGSQLDWNSLYGNIANASTQQQQTGLQEYNQTVPTVSGTQTVDPALLSQIQFQNAVDQASPSPTDAGIADIFTGLLGETVGGSGGGDGGSASC